MKSATFEGRYTTLEYLRRVHLCLLVCAKHCDLYQTWVPLFYRDMMEDRIQNKKRLLPIELVETERGNEVSSDT
jgi:hypothetical protein